MNTGELCSQIANRFARASSKQREDLARYAQLVDSFGARMNLTAAKSALSYDEILFSDADALDRCIEQSGLERDALLRCVDVGAGAGAPAIPLCILRPEVTFTLVEPLRKRVTFLRMAVGSLGLAARVRVLEEKLRWEQPDIAEAPFDLAISRATLAPERWLDVGRKLAPRVALFHSSTDHEHAQLELESQRHFRLQDGRERFVAIFRGPSASCPIH